MPAPVRSNPLPVGLELPWVASTDQLDIAQTDPSAVVDILLWAAIVKVLTSEDRDISLYLLLRDVGVRHGGEARKRVLDHLLNAVHATDAARVPVVQMQRLLPSGGNDLVTALAEWRVRAVGRPHFLYVKRSAEVRGLFPFDGPFLRDGLAREVNRVLSRCVDDFYGPSGQKGLALSDLDDLLFGSGLANVSGEVTEHQRVLALRLLLSDKRFPLIGTWRERLFENGVRERPLGHVSDADYLEIRAGLGPVLAAVGALYASPVVVQPTEIWAHTLLLAQAIRNEDVQKIRARPDLGPPVADLLAPSDDEERRMQIAATLIALVARQIVVTPQTAMMDLKVNAEP